MTITGTTRLILAIGDPVAQVRFPEIFTPLAAERGIDAVAVPMHIRPEGLPAAVTAFRIMQNLIGVSVTIPHKAAIAPLLDRLSERARKVGVVNAVRREEDGSLSGDIFDGLGFVAGLKSQGIDPAGAAVWQVGAGGAGTAVAFALLEAGVARLTLRDIDEARRAALAARLAQHWPGRVQTGESAADAIDIAINVTPMGLKPEDPLPFDPARLRPGTLVADVIMRPATTRLLAAAEARGLRIHRGHFMLDAQVEIYAEFLGLTRP